MSKIFCAIFCLFSLMALIIWAIREQIKQTRHWRSWELKDYLDDLYKITCKYCDSFGYVWRSTFPPRWLKHGNTWRQTEVEALKDK